MKSKICLREKYSFKDYYIESFSININDFLLDGSINKEKRYFICSYDGEMKDITSKIIFK